MVRYIYMEGKKSLLGSNIFRLLLAVLILCACAGLGAGIALLEDKSDPTEFVAGYFGKFLMEDYEGMLEYVDTADSFVTTESFVNLMSGMRAENNIGEYEFGELKKSGNRYVVTVSYKDDETGEDKSIDISLKKYRKSIKQIVADWKVSIDDRLVESYSVQIPEGMKLEIDGVTVDDTVADIEQGLEDTVKTAEGETIVIENEQKNTEMSSYRIENVLEGKHRLKAYSDFTQIVKDVEITAGNSTDVLSADDMTVNDQYLERIETNSAEMIKEFYEVVRNRKTSSDKLKTYFMEDEKVIKTLKKAAEKSQEIIFWPDTKNIDDYNLLECNFSDLQYTAQYIGENKIKAIYTFSYDYVSSTDTELYESYVFSISGKCDTTMELTYIAEDEVIKISEIKVKNKNKKSEDA